MYQPILFWDFNKIFEEGRPSFFFDLTLQSLLRTFLVSLRGFNLSQKFNTQLSISFKCVSFRVSPQFFGHFYEVVLPPMAKYKIGQKDR